MSFVPGAVGVPAQLPDGVTGLTAGIAAAAGVVGEYLLQSRLRSASLSLTSATPQNLLAAPLVLTAGEWDIEGAVGFEMAATTSVTLLQAAISLASATLPAGDTIALPTAGEVRVSLASAAQVPGGNFSVLVFPRARVLISASATYYIVTQSVFTVSTLSGYGHLSARRVR